MLAELLKDLSKIEGIEWIRLLYCYPDEIDQELLSEFSSNSKVCKYFDIPIQHASDRILKNMGRRGNETDIEELIAKIRKEVPGVVIRTTLIVGFPGEEDEDFEILRSFVSRMKFDRLGVFTYSKEEGTLAARLKPQVLKKSKDMRCKELMTVQKDISRRKNDERLGKVYKTLVEGIADDGIFYYGRTFAEAPDIDGAIYFTSSQPLETGTFVNVRILNIDDYDLIGDASYESAK
jgi:ribosomal protein S12 methylthiotransferase